MQMDKQWLGKPCFFNFPLTCRDVTSRQTLRMNHSSGVLFLVHFIRVLTERSLIGRGIRGTSWASSHNPNFISGSGIGGMLKSINIKIWSVEDKYILSWGWILSPFLQSTGLEELFRGLTEQTVLQCEALFDTCLEEHSTKSLIWFHFLPLKMQL